MRSLFVRKNWIAGLAVAAAFLLGASSASAISFTLAGANGQDVAPPDQVIITVSMNTEATTGITVMSVGVLFDDSRLTYNQGASSATSYLLYGGRGGGGFLKAAATCGGYPGSGAGCNLALPGQVNADYVSADLSNGTANTGSSLLVTLVFDLTGVAGSASIALSSSSPGNVVGQPGGGSVTPTLIGGAGVNVIPEPTTALLVGLGLVGLGVAGRRK